MKDTASNTKVAGIPAQNITNWHRQTILLKRLGEEGFPLS
jgi:UDP-3-O-[3-hydroxymyristoyl] glucosamine N-acyltransferase